MSAKGRGKGKGCLVLQVEAYVVLCECTHQNCGAHVCVLFIPFALEWQSLPLLFSQWPTAVLLGTWSAVAVTNDAPLPPQVLSRIGGL